MDHLPQISNPNKKVLRVPYLFDPRFIYDRKGIDGFDERCNFDWIESATDSESLQSSSFFQAWLFFGTLIEVFACNNVNIDPSDFISDDEDSRFITTSKLPYYTWLWIANALVFGPDCLESYTNTISDSRQARNMLAIERAQKIRDILDKVGAILHDLQSRKIVIQDHIWTSVLILCSTLRSSAIYLYRSCAVSFPEIDAIADLQSNFLNDNYQQGNWCPKERAALGISVESSFPTMILASQLNRLLTSKIHTGCTENTCEAYQVNDEIYKTEHVTEGCSCEFIGIKDVYSTDSSFWDESSSKTFHLVPVITFVKGQLTLKYAPSDITSSIKTHAELIHGMFNSKLNTRGSIHRSGKFIAISHVWAHGRGNPNANALPRCQLDNLQVSFYCLSSL
jgi:hypothetical protein